MGKSRTLGVWLALSLPAALAQNAQVSSRGAAATVDRYATETAVGVLEQGGNAVDAAVAAGLPSLMQR